MELVLSNDNYTNTEIIEFDIPSWMPKMITFVVTKEIETIKSLKKHEFHLSSSDVTPGTAEILYSHLSTNFNSIHKVFTSPEMEKVWTTLAADNMSGALELISALLRIDFKYASSTARQKFSKDTKVIKRGLEKSKSLLKSHQSKLHYPNKDFNNLISIVNNLELRYSDQQNANKSFDYYNEEYHLPRKSNMKNSKAIFTAKILSEFFRATFSQPYHDFVSIIINCIYDTIYVSCDIIKLTR